jgi:hypothetical protein
MGNEYPLKSLSLSLYKRETNRLSLAVCTLCLLRYIVAQVCGGGEGIFVAGREKISRQKPKESD